MKRVLFFLMVAVIGQSIKAQNNVGIGTTSPNPSAKLDISSTTQGLLIPRMNGAQRLGIASPVDGLMVYDNTSDRLYQYQAGAWKSFNNNDYWTTNGTDIYNTTLNVGIGNAGPTEKLHVTGNIRVTGDLLSTGDITMNNATGTVQLQNAGVNKGFVQLSGNNLRMGTNSGNTTGNMVIRLNGNDRVTINPTGDVDLDGKITRSAVTGPSSLLPICFGFIHFSGSILNGTTNFSVTRLSTGRYSITCADLNIYSVILLTTTTPDRIAGAFQTTPTTFEVDMNSVSIPGAPRDDDFYFMVYRPG